MTTDRELLEAAAKAAGRDPILWCGPNGWLCETTSGAQRYYWNPLTDDGDALRLAVALQIDVDFPNDHVVFADGNWSEPVAQDRAAATRRAIVRAAAALAKEPK